MSEQDPGNNAPSPVEQGASASPLERLSDYFENEGIEPHKVISGVRQFTDQASQILPEQSAVGLSISKSKNGGLHLWVHVPIKNLRLGEPYNEDEIAAHEIAGKIGKNLSISTNADIHSNIKISPHLLYYNIDSGGASLEELKRAMEEVAKEKQPQDDEFEGFMKPQRNHTPLGIIPLS